MNTVLNKGKYFPIQVELKTGETVLVQPGEKVKVDSGIKAVRQHLGLLTDQNPSMGWEYFNPAINSNLTY